MNSLQINNTASHYTVLIISYMIHYNNHTTIQRKLYLLFLVYSLELLRGVN